MTAVEAVTGHTLGGSGVFSLLMAVLTGARNRAGRQKPIATQETGHNATFRAEGLIPRNPVDPEPCNLLVSRPLHGKLSVRKGDTGGPVC